MRILETSRVGEEEIDLLGHMNIRRYAFRALRANRTLIDELGFDPRAEVTESDVYVRYHREQFGGAELAVVGGVLGLSELEIRAYYEIRSVERDELAASFIIASKLAVGGDRGLSAGASLPELAERFAAIVPSHGQPRSLNLSPPRLDLRLDDIPARYAEGSWGLAVPGFEWTIEPEICDANGQLSGPNALILGLWRPPSLELATTRPGPTSVTELEDGRRLGWATLEMRTVQVARAHVGQRMYSIGAELGFQQKVRHSRRWLFNLRTRGLVRVIDEVTLALDLDSRRAMDIPPSLRRRLESLQATEFA